MQFTLIIEMEAAEALECNIQANFKTKTHVCSSQDLRDLQNLCPSLTFYCHCGGNA